MRIGYVIFAVMVVVLTIMSIGIAYKAKQKKTMAGNTLFFGMIYSMLVGLTYLTAVSFPKTEGFYKIMSLFQSLYFFSVSAMLFFMLAFVFNFVGFKPNKYMNVVVILLLAWGIFDMVVLFINPFKEIALSYVLADGFYTYQMKPLYNLHLAFSYVMVLLIFIILLVKIHVVPKEYTMQYFNVFVIIFAIVLFNALFLFLPKIGINIDYDYSITAYAIGEWLCYWAAFIYPKTGMLNKFKTEIFDSIEQGMILFDFDGILLANNDRAANYLPNVEFDSNLKLAEFKNILNISSKNESGQIFRLSLNNQFLKVRCNYKMVMNEKNQLLGHLFVLTDETFDTDLLTGFHTYSAFKKANKIDIGTKFPLYICVVDINGLSAINSSYGHEKGDELIKTLSTIIKHIFPEDTYLLRGEEAELAMISYTLTAEKMNELIEEVKNSFDESIQYSINKTMRQEDIETCYIETLRSMRAKKMLDKDSSHSSLLTSLIKALEECDTDTEEHVRRTQLTGRKLAERLGLSDIETSNLSLLCILHDIGKIGIPLEIINKPSKLNDSEWDLMRSHVEKGYHIAKSTKQLEVIADMIRYHHERWDGTGYPDGLSRESIPVLSRIISVVDSFDAMTHDRIYRKAMSIEDAKKELIRCSGTQFDPSIVSEFIRLIDEDEEIKNEIENDSDYVEVDVDVEQEDVITNKNTITSNTHPITYSRYVLDGAIKIIEVDEYFEKLTGYSKEDVIDNNMTQLDLIPQADRIEYFANIQEPIATKSCAYLEHRIQRKDGEIIFVFCYGRQYYDSAAKISKTEIIVSNVCETHMIGLLTANEAKRSEKRLKQWENTYRRDSLTGLFNHAAYKSDIEDKLLKGDVKTLFIMLDVDKFKDYNDTYGHHAGDEFLIHLAQCIDSLALDNEYTCRMGGDEFSICVFANKDTSNEELEIRAKALFDGITVTIKALHNYTISMGAVISADEGENFISLYEKADKELYNAKHNGRNNLSIKIC